MRRNFIFLCALSLLCGPSLLAFPQAEPSSESSVPLPRIGLTSSQIVILQADADYVWGTYYFAISNPTGEDQTFANSLRLPLETLDFQPGDGLTNDDLSLQNDGSITVKKLYAPGLSLQGLQFKVKAATKAFA